MRFAFLIPFLLTSTQVLAHGISEEDKRRMLEGGYLQYVGLGATHMLTGYDHLAFIFGVIFFLVSFKDIVKFITAFTIGHCITLIFATFFKITANYYLIDAFIALTVCYKGFENLDGFRKYLDVKSPDLLKAVFFFGLVHGFGLSTRLQQLPLGDDPTAMFFRIICFNIGVEVGQIAALTVMLMLISTWRKGHNFKKFSVGANSLLIIFGGLLLIMQLHGYFHNKYPDDFGFSEDNHHHSHENTKKQEELNRLQTPQEDNLLGN